MSGPQKQSGPGGRKKPAYVTLTQKFDPQYWPGWDSAVVSSRDVGAIGHEMIRRIEAAGGSASGFWIVVQDRDRLPDGALKDAHLHAVIQQDADHGGRLHAAQIDAAIGFDKSVCRAPGRGARIENAQSYLIHAKDPDEFKYPVSDVVTLRGRSFIEIEATYRDAWARYAVKGRKETVSAKEWSELGDALVQRVLDGEVTELNILEDKALMDVYSRNDKKVDLALRNAFRVDVHREVQRLRDGEFRKLVIWIMGPRRAGKTRLVTGIVERLQSELGWRAYAAAAKNGNDDYLGQEIMHFDDPSQSVMEWPDMLHLLDPENASPLSSRYKNKREVAPRIVIFSVYLDPVQFGFFMPGKRSTGDSMDQLVDRIGLVVKVSKVGEGVDAPRLYSVAATGEVKPYQHVVPLPGGNDYNGYEKTETLQMGYGEIDAAENLEYELAVETILAEVGRYSSDKVIDCDPRFTLAGHRYNREFYDQLRNRGITVIDAPFMSAPSAGDFAAQDWARLPANPAREEVPLG